MIHWLSCNPHFVKWEIFSDIATRPIWRKSIFWSNQLWRVLCSGFLAKT